MAPGSMTDSLRETLALFEDGTPLATSEVAERLDLGRRSTYDRLQRLADGGRLETKKVGAKARVWWRPAADGEVAGSNRHEEFESLVEAVEEYAIFTLDQEGHVRTWNPGAERIKGYEAAGILGEHFSAFYTAEDRAAGVPERNLAAAAFEGSIEDEGWRVRADGSRFWANVTITAIRDDDGELEGYAKVTRDMTERKRAEAERELLYETTRAVAEAETFGDGLEGALRSVCEATVWEYAEAWIPTDGELRRADADHSEDALAALAAASEDVTFERDEGLPGRVWTSGTFEWLSDLGADTGDAFRRTEAAVAAGAQSALGVPVVADGDPVAVLAFVTTETRGADARLVETVSSVAAKLGTLVRRRRAEERAEREREFVDRLLEASPVGIMVLDTDGEVTRTNDRAKDVLAISEDEAETYSPADRAVHDEDGEGVAPENQPFARALATGEPVFDWEARVELPDGGHRWLSVNAAPVLDADGDVERVITTGEDVTRLKEQARQLERQRDALEDELDEVFARIDDGFYALDDEFRFTYVNERGEELLQRSRADLLGRSVWEVFPEATGTPARESLHEALESQQPTDFEAYFEPRSSWIEGSVYPSETGLSVHIRDVTERKERERELERYETLFEESKDVNVVVDADGRFQYVTPSVSSVFGYEREELIGEIGFEYIHPDDREAAVAAFGAMIEDPSHEPTVEFRFRHGDGSWITLEAMGRNLLDDPDIGAVVVYTRDVTERKERERELERYETLVETMTDGVYVVDDSGRFRMANDAYVEMVDLARDELLGAHVTDVVDEGTAARAQTLEGELLAGERDQARIVTQLPGPDGEAIHAEATFGLIRAADGPPERVGVVRDVTERRERERRLEESRRRYRTLVENFPNGAVALVDEELCYRTVGGTPMAAATSEDLEGRTVREALPDGLADELAPRYEAALDGEASAFDHEADGRDYQVRTLPVRDDDGDVFAAMGVSQDVTERRERERELLQQREQLAALNGLSEVVREITGAVIEQSTREEIEETVCERLAETDSYSFAWIGEADRTSRTVTVRTEAGAGRTRETPANAPESTDRHGESPPARALEAGTLQVTRDVDPESGDGPGGRHAARRGVRSTAAIPVEYDNTLYGVLTVYSDRPHAFEDSERAVVSQLGGVVGHAIAAAERKRALLSDEVVEVEFRLAGLFETVDADASGEGTIRIDETVPIRDDEYLVYGTATGDAAETLPALSEAMPHWTDLSRREDAGDTAFEARLSDPPVLSAVASLGGAIEEAVIDDGDYRMTVHLSPSTEVARVVEAVRESYPGTEMVARRQIERPDETAERVHRALDEDLTGRQDAVLRAAYRAGYFEWPRDVTGEDVAESLSISVPTFSQHLRKAEKKVFDALLGGAPASGG